MEKINAVITGVGGYVPDYILTNDEISKMVDTNDEWIMTRIGVKERHILNEEGLGTSYMARKAAKQLMQRTGSNPDDVDLVIVATSTPDYQFPSIASILCDKLGLKNAFAFDMSAACCGFLYMLETAANFIRSGRYKKVIIVGADKMSSIVNYTDRATCPIFGDGAAAFMLEPTTEELGVMDAMLRTDGKGLPFLHLKAGGSVCPPSYFTIDNHMHYLYQEGRTVFKYAVSNMSDISAAIAEKNNLTKDTIDWVVPHQANLRIIDAVAHRLEVPHEKVLINIDRYGNTSAGTLPLCIWDFEEKLKQADLFLLCSPHNPLGHVWTEEELRRMMELCLKHHVLVVSDEIHSDLIFHGKKHIPTATLSPEIAANVITGISGTKTFNLAGLQASTVVFPNAHKKEVFDKFWMNMDIHRNNAFSLTAMEAAFNQGEEWLDQLLPYLSANFDYVVDYCEKRIPKIKTYAPDATYLMWLDCRELGMGNEALHDFMIRKASNSCSVVIPYLASPGLSIISLVILNIPPGL